MGPVGQIIVMVGLPARGKTYIAKKLTRYLNWIGVNTKVFNAGDYRRQVEATIARKPKHTFFNPANPEGKAIREQCMEAALTDALNWLETGGGDVAIFDATNTTRGVVQLCTSGLSISTDSSACFSRAFATVT